MEMSEVLYWHWLVLGGVFIVLEMILPGTFMLWIGISAGIVGGMLAIFPEIPLAWQLIVFAVLSVLTVTGWKFYLRKHPIKSEQPTVAMRGQEYVNRVFVLTEAVVNGYGRAKVDDGVWTVKADDDIPAGASVVCTGVDGTVLVVKRAAAR